MSLQSYVEPASEAASASWRIWIPSVSLSGLREDRLHVLLWQMGGSTDLIVEGEAHLLVEGHALWIPVGTPHEFTVHSGSVLMPLFFDVADTATTLRTSALVTVGQDLRTLMLAYVAATHSLIKPRANLARQILALMEDQPALSAVLPMPTSEPAQLIAEALRFNPGDTRSVEELARSVHTSSRTVRREFETETGMSLREWRIRNRMDAAATLLRSDTRVDAVAHRVGYTNVNAFRRVFHAHFGLSPTEYLRRYKTQ